MRPSDLAREFGNPVAYYPGLVKHLGSVNAVLMFCQFFYWTGKEQSELGIYKSVEEIQAETGLSYREQATARKQLVDRGILIETHKRLEHRIYYRIDMDKLDALLESAISGDAISPTAEPVIPELRKAQFVEEQSDNPRTAESAIRGMRKAQFDLTENTTENTSEITDTISVVFDHWRSVMASPRSKLDDKRRRLIKAALKNYSVEDLKAAIDGCRASPWHMGKNDRRQKYNGLDLILRNAEKIDQFMSYRDQPPAGAGRGYAPNNRHHGLDQIDYSSGQGGNVLEGGF